MTLARLASRFFNRRTVVVRGGVRTYSSAAPTQDQESALQIAILNSFARWVRARVRQKMGTLLVERMVFIVHNWVVVDQERTVGSWGNVVTSTA